MTDINVINRYANPAFNAKEEALTFFTTETSDQYRGFSHQLEQLEYDTESALKESVFDHYTEFIGFSAEVQKMDDAMEQLKKNLTKTYKVLDNLKDTSLTIEDTGLQAVDTKALVIPDNLAWIKTVCDDIDLFVFQRRFTEAVDLCIRAQNELAAVDTSVNPLLLDLQTKLTSKSEILVSKLVSELFSPDSSRSERRRVCRLLSGLGKDREAGILYLKRAHEEIENHHRLVKPCGDIPSLVAGMSELFFECLQDTVVNFQGLFGNSANPANFGICLSWLTKEIDEFVHEIMLMAMGYENEVIINQESFASFALCILPLLQGASNLSDIGCMIDGCIVKIIGEKVEFVVNNVVKSIVSHIKDLPTPELETTAISFKSQLGTEKRTVSTHCAAVYNELSQFIQSCPNLLVSALCPYLVTPLQKGFDAIASIESMVYEKWVKDKENKKIHIVLTDLYFMNNEMIPYLIAQFIPKMGQFGNHMMNTFNKICYQLCNLIHYFIYPFIPPIFGIPLFHANMESPVNSPEFNTVAAIKRVLYVLKQTEKVMINHNYTMMKKAIFTSIYAMLSKDSHWKEIEAGKFSEDGFNAFVLNCAFIQTFGPNAAKSVYDGLIEKARVLGDNLQLPSSKWLTKCMNDSLKQCRK